MQQFLLLYTMLIVASEAFSQELHGSRIPRSIRRRTSRFANKLIPSSRDRLAFPLFSPPPAYHRADHEEPSVVPRIRRKGFHPPKRRNKRRFSSSKQSRRKYSKRRGWSPLDVDPGRGGHDSAWPTPFNPRGFLPEEFDPRFVARNPNTQYIVHFYPVFIRPRKRRFLNLRRQCLTSLRNKNKRSAGNVTREVSLEGDVPKNDGNVTGDDGKVPETSLEIPLLDFPSAKSESDSNTHREWDRYRFDDFQKYQKNDFDFNPYFDQTRGQVTQPSVTFRYPYDRKLFEPFYRLYDRFPTVKKENPAEDRSKKPANSSKTDFGKLKDMLREVESMLGAENNLDKDEDYKYEDSGSEKTDVSTDSTDKLNDTISLKQKIDHIAIPVLTQISERLGNLSSTVCRCPPSWSSSSSPSSSSNSSSNSSSSSSSNSSSSSLSKLANYCCSADGTWKSSAYGVEFNFSTLPNMMLKVSVPWDHEYGEFINHKWSIQGLTLSRHGGPLILAAIYPQKRKIASFMGQCKTCQDQDLIFGSWTVFGCVHKFTDLWSAVETKLDVLKKVKAEPMSSWKKYQKKVKALFKSKG